MKTKLLLTIGFLMVSVAVWAQTDTNTISDKEIDQYEKIKEKIKAMSDKIANADKEKIADLVFSKKVTVYSVVNKEVIKQEADVSKVYIDISDGVIKIVDVELESFSEKFTNLRCPIGLTARRFEKNIDKLYMVQSKNSKWIELQELIHLINWKQYLPDDIEITYYPKDSDFIPLYKNAGINTVFDIRLYSDALAFLGQEKNGLAQTDFRFKQFIHRSNFPNHSFFLLQYFNINFNYAKFDSKDEYINEKSFSNADLLRKRYVNAEVSLNLLNTYIGYKLLNKFYMDAGSGVGLNKLAKTNNDSLSFTHTNIFIEAGTNFKFGSNGGVNLNIRALRLFSPSTTSYNDELNSNYFNYMKYGAEIYWNPQGNLSSRLFVRGNYIEPTSSTYKKDGFLQIQVGYSLLLSEMISIK